MIEQRTTSHLIIRLRTAWSISNRFRRSSHNLNRMLSYFQQEGFVALSRGVVTLTDKAALQAL